MIFRRFTRPSEMCQRLWGVYMDTAERGRNTKPPWDTWARENTERALNAFFDAVERELEDLNKQD
jgi:hypothetical protein